MHIIFACEPSWFGSWRVRLERDPERGWSIAARVDRSPAGFARGSRGGGPLAAPAGAPGAAEPGAGGVPAPVARALTDRESAELERHLAELALPLVPAFAMGLDGTRWTLEVANGWNRLQLEWWPALPPEWAHLRPFTVFLASLAQLPPGHPGQPS